MTKLEEQLIDQNAKLLSLIEQLTAQNKQLSEQVKLLNQKIFGRSSEKGKGSKDPDENQLSLFQDEKLNVLNEAEEAADPTVMEPSFEEIESYRRKKPRRKKEDLFEGLETEIVEYQLEDDQCQCEWCNSQLRPIGKEFVRNEVIYIPARVKRVDYYRHAYECPTCKKDGADNIVKAPTPKPVISKSYASPSSVSWLLHQKFEMSLPFNRQEKEWASYGIPLSRATMANWVISVSNQWLKPLYEEMHRQILTSSTLHSDETTTQVLQASNCDNPDFVEGYKKARALAMNLAYGRFSVKQDISSVIVPFYRRTNRKLVLVPLNYIYGDKRNFLYLVPLYQYSTKSERSLVT